MTVLCVSNKTNNTKLDTINTSMTERQLDFLFGNSKTGYVIWHTNQTYSRSQWPCGLRRRSAAARLQRSWVRIPPWAWMFVYCECCVLSGRDLCDELIIRPEESYRLWHVVVCDQETSKTRRLKPTTGLWKIQPQLVVKPGKPTHNKTNVQVFSVTLISLVVKDICFAI